jgi:hypothetical protein
MGSVESLVSLGGAVISVGQLGPLQLTRRGIENNIGRTVDYSGLESRIGVAKRYRGGHRGRSSLTTKGRQQLRVPMFVRDHSAAMA